MECFEKIKVYLHVAVMNHWEAVLCELLEDMRISTLREYADVTLVAVGGNLEDRYGCRVVNTGSPLSEFEFPALQLLYSEVEANSAICYAHLKGVSQPGSLGHRAWRRELSEFTIIDWKSRLLHLVHRHTSGPRVTGGGAGWNWEFVNAHKHYSGNFWWARSDYLLRLPEPSVFRSQFNTRYAAEAWIGQSPLINEYIQ